MNFFHVSCYVLVCISLSLSFHMNFKNLNTLFIFYIQSFYYKNKIDNQVSMYFINVTINYQYNYLERKKVIF